MEDEDPIAGKNILRFCGPTSTEARLLYFDVRGKYKKALRGFYEK